MHLLLFIIFVNINYYHTKIILVKYLVIGEFMLKLTKEHIKLHLAFLMIIISIFLKEIIFNSGIVQGLNNKLGILDSLIIAFLYFILNIILKKNKHLLVLYLLDVFISILMFVNLIFYRSYGDLLTIGLFSQVKQLDSVSGSILSLIYIKDFLLFIDLPILYYFIFKKINNEELKLKYKLKGTFFTFTLCVLFCAIMFIRNPSFAKAEFSRRDLFKGYGIIGMYFIDNYNYISNNVLITTLSKDDEGNIDKELKISTAKYQQNDKKNLIMIQVESLEQFIIGKSYNGKEITPNLNKLINESAYFNNCYYQIGLGHTADAELIVNTGLYPLKDGTAHIIKYNNKYNALAGYMNKEGYTSYALHGNKGDYWNRNVIFKDYGFDTFYDLNKLKKDEIIDIGLSDRSFFGQATEILKNIRQPFYSFLITITSHSPFNVNNDFCGTKTSIEKYYNAINYTDKYIGSFLDELNSKGILQNSIVVIYGDHNAITYDLKNELSKEVSENLDENYSWQKYQKIPLIIRFPNGEKSGVYTNSVGQIDIKPTIANILRLSGVNYFGNDVFDGKDNQVILRDGSYIIGNNFYDNKLKSTNDMENGKKIENDINLIEKAQNQLKASDDIFKYNYFSTK